jgi:DNA modification methylase
MKAYYQDENITLYQGDCRDILPQLSGEFFAFTDPPYNVGKDYKGWNDSMPESEYLAFCGEWIKEVKRLAPEICIYTPKKYQMDYWRMLGRDYQQIVLPWTLKGAIRGGLVDQYATLLTNAKPKERIKNVWPNVQMQGMGYFFKEKTFGHPGYTSEDLTGRVLRSLADPNLPVLDPFGGTGTTACVAAKLGQKCITIEYSKYWCDFIVKERLAQLVLFSAAPI